MAHGTEESGEIWAYFSHAPCQSMALRIHCAEASHSPMRKHFLPSFQRWVNSSKCISFLWLVYSCLLPSGLEWFDVRPYKRKLWVLTSGTLKQTLVLSTASHSTLILQKRYHQNIKASVLVTQIKLFFVGNTHIIGGKTKQNKKTNKPKPESFQT